MALSQCDSIQVLTSYFFFFLAAFGIIFQDLTEEFEHHNAVVLLCVSVFVCETTTISFCPRTFTWNIPSRCLDNSSFVTLDSLQPNKMQSKQTRPSKPAAPRAIRIRTSFFSFWKVCPSVVWLTSPSLSSWMLTTAVTKETTENAVKHMIRYGDFLFVEQTPNVPVIIKKPPLHIGDTLWANHTSALMLDTTPTQTLTSPTKKWRPERTNTDVSTTFTIFCAVLSGSWFQVIRRLG